MKTLCQKFVVSLLLLLCGVATTAPVKPKLRPLQSGYFILPGGSSLCVRATRNAYWKQRAFISMAESGTVAKAYPIYLTKNPFQDKNLALPPGGPWAGDAKVSLSADFYNENPASPVWQGSAQKVYVEQSGLYYKYLFNDTESRFKWDLDQDFNDIIVELWIVRGRCAAAFLTKEEVKPVVRPPRVGRAEEPTNGKQGGP